MGKPFIWIYNFFRRFKVGFYFLLIGISVYCYMGISRLQWNNDIFSIFPKTTSSAAYRSKSIICALTTTSWCCYTSNPSDTSLQSLLGNAEWWENKLNTSPYYVQSQGYENQDD
jgi:hypothetical protein